MKGFMASLALAISFSAAAAGVETVAPDDVPDVLVRTQRTVLPKVRGAAEDYSRNCQGCHGHLGHSVAEVPRLKDRVGLFTHTPEGRAYLNERLDLAQAEAVADLIDAATAQAVRSAARSLTGEFSRAVHALADALTETAGPGLWARSLGGRRGAGRRAGVLGACRHQVFEFSPVQPHAAAGGAHVELDPGALHGLHGAVVIGAKKKRHERVPSKEERRNAATGDPASRLKTVASDISATAFGTAAARGPGSHPAHGARVGGTQGQGPSPTLLDHEGLWEAQ